MKRIRYEWIRTRPHLGCPHADNATGIEVLDDGTVRVMAGPTDVVTNNVALELGFSRKVEDFEIGAKLELSGR